MRATLTLLLALLAVVGAGCVAPAQPEDFFIEDLDASALTWLAPVASEPVEQGEPVEFAVYTRNPEARVVRFVVNGVEVGACDASDAAAECHEESVFRHAMVFDVAGTHSLVASFTTASGRTVEARMDLSVVAPDLTGAGGEPADDVAESPLDDEEEPEIVDEGPSEVVESGANGTVVDAIVTPRRGYLDKNWGWHRVCRGGRRWRTAGARVALEGAELNGSLAEVTRCVDRYGASIRRYADRHYVSRASVVAALAAYGNCGATEAWRRSLVSPAVCAAMNPGLEVTSEACRGAGDPAAQRRCQCRVRMAAVPDFAIETAVRYLARRRGRASYAGLRSPGRRHFGDPPRIAAVLRVGAVRCATNNFFRFYAPDRFVERYVAAYNAYRVFEERAVPDTCPPARTPGRCEARGCGDDGAGGACGPGCGAGEACTAAGRCEPQPAPACARRVDVVVYNQGGWGAISSAFRAAPNPCAHYWVSIPPVTASEANPNSLRCPRAGTEAAEIRALGSRFHAMAEFHWSGKPDLAYPAWAGDARSWYDRGVAFRERMETAGYHAAEGDTWAVNEFPSTTRYSERTRANIRALLRGLYEGPPGAPHVQGAVFMVGFPQTPPQVGLGPYHERTRGMLEDADFWQDMSRYVRFWGMEVYGDPRRTCAADSVGAQSADLNQYLHHPARLAAVGGARTAAARAFFDRAYTPLMNAVWGGEHYFTRATDPENMERFVSLQVYAARAWADDHAYPDGRIGFAWDHPIDLWREHEARVARRIAEAIRDAYAPSGGGAARACSPTGSVGACLCRAEGASRTDAWAIFDRWQP